jgi:hypothetical protein
MGSIMAKQIIVAHFVTEAQAEAVLAEVGPLRHRPRIAQFREQLDATVGTVWAIHCAAVHYRAVGRGLSALRAKTVLAAMEESSASPENGQLY